jgi:PilZ domain
MQTDLIRGLLFQCRHQFSWPRRDAAGLDYQVCVSCGAKYGYDWSKMRRVAPLALQEEEAETRHSAHRKCGSKSAWVPRERRLRHQVPVLFRTVGGQEWLEGESENISHAGLLFRTAEPLVVEVAVELKLEMPRELSGDDRALVLCQASVVRVETVPATRKKMQDSYRVACAIQDYSFTADSK